MIHLFFFSRPVWNWSFRKSDQNIWLVSTRPIISIPHLKFTSLLHLKSEKTSGVFFTSLRWPSLKVNFTKTISNRRRNEPNCLLITIDPMIIISLLLSSAVREKAWDEFKPKISFDLMRKLTAVYSASRYAAFFRSILTLLFFAAK